MKGTKIQRENGKVKYVYDYPDNREVSKHLSLSDKQMISFRTGFSMRYVNQWCQGSRRSRRIEEMARNLAGINKATARRKEKYLNQVA